MSHVRPGALIAPAMDGCCAGESDYNRWGYGRLAWTGSARRTKATPSIRAEMTTSPPTGAAIAPRRYFGLMAATLALTLAAGAHAQSSTDRYQADAPFADYAQNRAAPPLDELTRGVIPQVAAPNPNDRYKPDEIEIDTRGSRLESRGARAAASEAGRLRRPRPPSEFEAYVSQMADKPLRRFGENLLEPLAHDFTTPSTTTVPPDYRLNPGDELIVGLTGSVQATNLRLTIDSEGRVFVPRVGAVNVGGVRYGDVQAVLAQHVARLYRDFKVAVSIGQLHGITVYVTGFAATPGSYTVSSLSTLVNAVLAAGGPSAGGSFRAIQVRRGGQLVSSFDLYDLLLKGDKRSDIVLQNGDVIHIDPVGAQVAVIGSVNNEAVFEARPDDTLNDVLVYAGGPNTVADDSRLLLLDPVRPDSAGWEQLTPAQASSRVAKRGEIVRVLSALGLPQPLLGQSALVTVSGEVARPGRYYVPPGTALSDVIGRAGGLTSKAYPYATVFTRESVKLEQRLSYDRALRDVEFLLTVQPLTSSNRADAQQSARMLAIDSVVEQLKARRPEGRVVLDISPSAASLPGDLSLENNDSIYVPPPPTTVGVFGSVPSPSSFQYRPNTRLREFLDRAGGVQSAGERSKIFVVRANGTLLAPRRGLFAGSILNDRALPGDLIFVPFAGYRDSIWTKINGASQLAVQAAIVASSLAVVTR